MSRQCCWRSTELLRAICRCAHWAENTIGAKGATGEQTAHNQTCVGTALFAAIDDSISVAPDLPIANNGAGT
jgi:hypothetical protein